MKRVFVLGESEFHQSNPFQEGSDPWEYDNLTIFRRANSLSFFAHFDQIFNISSTLSCFCQVAGVLENPSTTEITLAKSWSAGAQASLIPATTFDCLSAILRFSQ